MAFDLLKLKACAEVANPEWWSDEGLKALSARVMKAAPDDGMANLMRAWVLSGECGACWENGPRSTTELKKAATHFDRAAACPMLRCCVPSSLVPLTCAEAWQRPCAWCTRASRWRRR